jgi:hypothetical protein
MKSKRKQSGGGPLCQGGCHMNRNSLGKYRHSAEKNDIRKYRRTEKQKVQFA